MLEKDFTNTFLKLGIAVPPTHPHNGQPFIGSEGISIGAARTPIHEPPPMPPTRALYEWSEDADDYVYVRDRTDEDLDEARKAFDLAEAKWKKTGGITFTRGPVRISGRFVCADGSWASGDYADGAWHWTAWESRGAAAAER